MKPAPISAPAPWLALVANDLPVYPIGREERLDGQSFVKWQTQRWLASRTFKLASWEVQGMARALFDLCQTESPAGSLPADEAELAWLLRCDVRRLRELRAMEFGPLRNWQPCLSDGEVRLMHPVVTEQIRDALDRRALAQLSKEEKARAMRLERLSKALLANGLCREVVADPVLIGRMDEWLAGHHKGNRTAAAYRSAILHAVQSGWIGRASWSDPA